MQKQYDLNGRQRKDLCQLKGEVVEEEVVYLGTPTYAYQIGDIKVDRECQVTGVSESIHQAILQAGFEEVVENISDEDDDGLTISVPAIDEVNLEKLNHLLQSKSDLIKKALKADQISFYEADGQLHFLWFNHLPSPETIQASSLLITKMIDYVKRREWISNKPTQTDNDKYSFRVFLLSIGLIGPSYKEMRKILLKDLTGNTAFRHPKGSGSDE
ncbi:hypothetical protein ACWOBX_00855 [Facklamia languida]